MANGESRETMTSPKAMRGLWKLMLKLPSLRGKLQILAVRDGALESLCEAYEEASEALSNARLEKAPRKSMLEEYQNICDEIETEVINYCLLHR